MISHLCVADLMFGISSLIRALLAILQWKVFFRNAVIDHMILFVGYTCGKYLITVSTLILDVLTLMKMLKVTKNKWYRKSKLRRICYCIWGGTFIVTIINRALYHGDVFPDNMWPTIQGMWFSILTFPSIIVQFFCFWKIIIFTKGSLRRPGLGCSKTRSEGNFQKIIVFQLISFIVCQGPLSVYLLLLAFNEVELEKRLTVIFVILASTHCIVDPTIFFIVYRHRWRSKRQSVAIKYD